MSRRPGQRSKPGGDGQALLPLPLALTAFLVGVGELAGDAYLASLRDAERSRASVGAGEARTGEERSATATIKSVGSLYRTSKRRGPGAPGKPRA